MKKVFSLLLASVLTMSMFAATKTVATVEKLWSGAALGWSTANSRQWTGYGEYVYWADKATHSIVGTKDGLAVDTVIVNDKIDGTAFNVDGAGNFVVEGTFPSTPSHIFLVKRADTTFVDIPITGLGRTDIVTATGDVFSADGGVVFLYGNSVNLLAVTIKNAGDEVTREVIAKEIAIEGSNVQNFVVAGDTLVQYVMRRSAGQTGFDLYENGVNKGSLKGMTGYKHTTLGGAMVKLSGKDFAIYPVGATNYSSEFSVLNMQDSALVADKADASKFTFCANTTTAFNGTNVGVFVNATKIDENNAYIQVGNGSDGTALFKLTVSVSAEVTLSCDDAQGTVEGAGDVAVGANATVKAVAKPGYEFVAWMKGSDEVSKDATYTFAVTENIALTAKFEAKENVTVTLAVNDDKLGSITLPEGIKTGENSVVYGTAIELTAVPAEGATFMGWFKGEDLYASDYTITLNSKESISLTAKFTNILMVAYELNGGVTNDYGWTSKSDMFDDFMHTCNPTWDWKTYAYYKEQVDPLGSPNICAGLTNCEPAFTDSAKWYWLKQYIVDVTAAQVADGATELKMTDVTSSAAWRYAAGAFFVETKRASWPVSADFAIAGTEAAFIPVWEHAFANPTEVVAEFTLNEPYKKGFTFDGWYATADFSGEKITKVSPESVIAGGKLYAKWIEYIPTIAEFNALPKGTESKVKGTVSKVIGSNFWIQDATGGLLCYGKNNGLKAGELAVLSGKADVYGGIIELNNAVVVSKEEGTPVTAEKTTLAAIVADTMRFMSKLVKLEGVLIAREDGNIYLRDGDVKLVCYKLTLDSVAFPNGTKVTATPVVGMFNGTMQFRANAEDILSVAAAGKDTYAYPVRGAEGEFEGYTLKNEWIYSNKLENYTENQPAAADMARGMAVKNGIMYFVNRTIGGFTRVDAKTGVMLDPLPITGDHLFEAEKLDEGGNPTGEWASAVTLKFNDVKVDNAGNLLIGACVSNTGRVMIYKVDETTGAATELINERLYDNVDEGFDKISWRFDYYGVYGDVNNDAVIMACNSWGMNAFRWEITGGVAGKAELVSLEPDDIGSLFVQKDGEELSWLIKPNDQSPQAPQIFPLDNGMFYVDFFASTPLLFDADGYLVDDMLKNPSGSKIANNEGDTCKLGYGPNGLCEFQVGDEYFLAMVATNTDGTPNTAFALYKYKDANKSFAEMEPLWFFPNNGMGAASNPGRACVPYVSVNGNTATIYLYAANNGYAVYTFKGKGEETGLNVIEESMQKAVKAMENGVIYIYRNGVKYDVMGAQVK
ncbi:MAG: InlB B-repeat-containing protein [Paludibacteraceae bacterium]|nr:InlB B-repeat-containing protein [Paludibacteraceae bacterium]